jgi:hypothetical protein
VRVELDLSALDNFKAASSPNLFAVLSENEIKQQRGLQPSLSEVRYEFDLSASAKAIHPSVPI